MLPRQRHLVSPPPRKPCLSDTSRGAHRGGTVFCVLLPEPTPDNCAPALLCSSSSHCAYADQQMGSGQHPGGCCTGARNTHHAAGGHSSAGMSTGRWPAPGTGGSAGNGRGSSSRAGAAPWGGRGRRSRVSHPVLHLLCTPCFARLDCFSVDGGVSNRFSRHENTLPLLHVLSAALPPRRSRPPPAPCLFGEPWWRTCWCSG